MFAHSTKRRRLAGVLLGGSVATVLALTGCAGPGGAAGTPTPKAVATQADIDAALQEDTTLQFWAWGPQYQAEVDAFMKEYPKVKVVLTNNGSNATEYTKLQNVIKAGSGIPDIAQIEYTALPQFAFGDSLVDMAEYGVASMEDKFSSSTWNQVNVNGGIYGLPQDAGPLAMFYRQDVFDQYGLTVPTTWEEYYETAEKLHAADPSKFMAADGGEAAFTNAMIWQAGGKPYAAEDTDVTVDLQDEGSLKWADMWTPLVQEDLVEQTPTFTPEWTSGLSAGKYATWVGGAWAAGTLQRRIPEAAGTWRVAPLPQYEAGDTASGEQGGSSSAVLDASENKLAAIGFVQWMSSADEAAKIWTDNGGFPAQAATLASDDWLNAEIPYFGGQQINQVFAASADGVLPGWQFLPFQAYADSVYSDTMGQAYASKGDLADGLKAWQGNIVDYGNSQGFSVNK
ncbi:ABC transporter substrate-binding protein [Herbiconiux daphne]|uniref:Extracellular solute-binding protein n=1 Tax=Herbiconiux daphne TaxID=2970914 RepID=A0ABT2GX27_9MICO|nr:extracellular solute-binding protein [Herbiconiux daphne]MCS5732512.1 extracellular solute-binding protein [Herbiconiux daphne]